MSSQELQELRELRQRLEEERLLRERAERIQLEEQRRREQAERAQNQAELQLRLQTQQTTLPEFLDACHVHLFLGLSIQQDKDSSTKGDPANADRKLRPEKIREWTSFPAEQALVWEDLMDAEFVTERHFTPLVVLKEYGKETRQRMVSSELDLGYFERQTMESRVSSVVEQLHADPQLRQTFCLNGKITFENHGNTLTDDSNLAADMDSLTITQNNPRRSQRLAAKSSSAGQSAEQGMGVQRAAQVRSPRPRADQFCVYNNGPDEKIPAFIVEYKVPHKVSLAHIKAGLQEMNLDEVLRFQEKEPPEDICRRTIAAVITQAFSYMIQGGLEYGYVCTGEAFIFLRVPPEDPETVYYYLSVPEEDVGPTTGWVDESSGENRLHLTAIGQVLAFTLRALRVPVRDVTWKSWATSRLKTWEMVYDVLLGEIEEKDIPSSEFKPPTRSRKEYCRVSPVKTRSRSAAIASCNPSRDSASASSDDSGDGYDPDTPSRQPQESRILRPPPSSAPGRQGPQGSRSQGSSRQYCTQECLQGLVKGGDLDLKCPNVSDHGVDRHRLNRKTLIRKLDKQLSNDKLHPDSKLGCESLHVHGTRGALFKITLHSHGYTFVGKGVPVEFVQRARHEELVYSRLTPIQGTSVPIFLGGLPLRRPFSYDGIAEMVHLMCMGYAGKTLVRQRGLDPDQMLQQAANSLQAVHALGVLHSDPIPGNIVWDERNGRVMFIDFERSIIQNKRRLPLGVISPNKNSKQAPQSFDIKWKPNMDCFEREQRRMINGLR